MPSQMSMRLRPGVITIIFNRVYYFGFREFMAKNSYESTLTPTRRAAQHDGKVVAL